LVGVCAYCRGKVIAEARDMAANVVKEYKMSFT